MPTKLRSRGGALLVVLWLSAALSAIAFTVANTVRGEIERTHTAADGVRSYFLARAAVNQAILYMYWGPGPLLPDGTPRYWRQGMPFLRFSYPSGDAIVQIVPESAKLNINTAQPLDIQRLLVALGANPELAQQITMAIVDWRTPMPAGQFGPFDSFYLAQTPSFRARHASFEEIEELLLVRGMTPELFYGTYVRDAQSRLVPVGGLMHCVSVYSSGSRFDANSVEPALLLSMGASPEEVARFVERRTRAPFRTLGEVNAAGGGPVFGRLGLGGNTMYTVRATATLRLANGQPSDVRRSVAALVKFADPTSTQPFQILRWYDNAGTR